MKPLLCVKIGGIAAENKKALKNLLSEMKSMQEEYRIILVHGGGKAVSAVTEALGLKPQFINGIRQTSTEEMEIVEMVLAGKMNKELVRTAGSLGVHAAGLSGSDCSTFTGQAISSTSRTGKITSVKPEFIQILLENKILPIISSVSMDGQGAGLNINADEAAREIAISLNAEFLVYISDIPGVLINGKCITSLSEEESRKWIKSGEIHGGMVPKVTSSFNGLHKGIRQIVISSYSDTRDLHKMVTKKAGTTISI